MAEHSCFLGKIAGNGTTDSNTAANCYSAGNIEIRGVSEEVNFAYISNNGTLDNCIYKKGANSIFNCRITDYNKCVEIDDLANIENNLGLSKTEYADYGVFNKTTCLYEYMLLQDFKVENNKVYDSPLPVDLCGKEATLNGETFTGNTITDAGIYRLEIMITSNLVRIINFEVNEYISGIADGRAYSLSARATFENVRCKVDNEVYESGTTISEIGNHTLSIEGANGFYKEYNFVIIPVIKGVTDNRTYSGSVAISVSRNDGGTFTLDNNTYTSLIEHVILTPGRHVLTVHGSNGYSKTITFTINPDIESASGALSQGITYEYEGKVRFAFSGGDAYIDGDYKYNQGEEYSIVGNHVLRLFGSYGQVYTYKFTIKPLITGVIPNVSYREKVTINISGGEALLNGKSIPIGEDILITEPGMHHLEVRGENGYVLSTEFGIILNSQLTHNEENDYYEFYFSGGTCYLDGKEFSGGIIDEIGHHAITVKGTNDSEHFNRIIFIKGNIDIIPVGLFDEPPVIPILKAKVYLDGKLINVNDSNYRVEEKGEHVLRVVGVTFDRTYNFEYQNKAYEMVWIYSLASLLGVALLGFIVILRRRKA